MKSIAKTLAAVGLAMLTLTACGGLSATDDTTDFDRYYGQAGPSFENLTDDAEFYLVVLYEETANQTIDKSPYASMWQEQDAGEFNLTPSQITGLTNTFLDHLDEFDFSDFEKGKARKTLGDDVSEVTATTRTTIYVAPPDAAVVAAGAYHAEHGGSLDVYLRILRSTDCQSLQESFDRAADNSETADSHAEADWTLGYLSAADDRMTEIGCYD